MSPSPTTVGAADDVVEAARLMAAHDIGSLPVVDGEDLVGIVTDRDLVLQVLARDLDPHTTAVSTVCSEDPIAVGPEHSLEEALELMAREQVRRLPVVEDGRLVGILAQADVSRAANPEETGRMLEEISKG